MSGHVDSSGSDSVPWAGSLGLDRQSSVPLHSQLSQQLREAILDGRLSPNLPLPTEPVLARQVRVSRFTLRQALTELVQDGLLRRERGRGTFIAEPAAIPESRRLIGFDYELQPPAHSPVRVLRVDTALPSPDVAAAIGISMADAIIQIVRLRIVNERPAALERFYVPHRLAPDLARTDLRDPRLYRVLERRANVRLTHAEQTLRVAELDHESAGILGVAPGSLALYRECVVHAGDLVVVMRRSFHPAGESRYRLELDVADIA